MKSPLAGVCSRDIQCETGHRRYRHICARTPPGTNAFVCIIERNGEVCKGKVWYNMR